MGGEGEGGGDFNGIAAIALLRAPQILSWTRGLPRLVERGRCTNHRIGPNHVGPFFNNVNLIDCSFSTTNANDVILGRSYVGPILPLVQRPGVELPTSPLVRTLVKIATD